MQLVGGYGDQLAHAAVGVYAQHLKTLAAVRATAATGQAAAAVQVGLDGDVISHLHLVDAIADGDDLGAKLVAENAWIGEEGLATAKSMQVGAADPDTVDTDEGFTRAWIPGGIGVGLIETAWFGQDKSFHLWLRWSG